MAEGAFDESSFDQGDLRLAKAPSASFARCTFVRSDLSGCILRGSRLRFADLSHALMVASDCRDADLQQAVMHRTQTSQALFDGANMKDVTRTDPALARAEDFVAGKR
jgi:uncharacterized protein YjbI with pentapeptide repeats